LRNKVLLQIASFGGKGAIISQLN